MRKDKITSKVRIVYDASCSDGTNPSLNQCLHVGPSFGQSILDILIRFRTHKVALLGDIEKAFLMVGVERRDRDVLRFLWFDNPQSENPNIVKYRFARVVFGVSSSPFLLNATIKHHIERYIERDPKFVAKFLQCIYVDDLTTGASNVELGYEFYLKAKLRLAEAGFNLCKFVSNSTDLMRRILVNEGQGTEAHTNSTLPLEHKVLGVTWKPLDDQLWFDIREVNEYLKTIEPTKRNVVGIAAKIYDPLGILSPLTIVFKVFFQRLCKCKLGWDEPLSEELDSWKKLASTLDQANSVVIDRYLPGLGDQGYHFIQLVGFCDASLNAYAAVVYLRVVREASTSVSILASKTRVAPLKTITIPRLELLSALLLARLTHLIYGVLQEQIPLQRSICFTDSKISLGWIHRTDREWKQFVENRTSEIRKLIPPHCWIIVPEWKIPQTFRHGV